MCPGGSCPRVTASRDSCAGPLLRAGGPQSAARLPGRSARSQGRPGLGTIGAAPMPIEFAHRIRRIPTYPLAAGYDLGTDVAMLASNESCFGPLPEVVEAARAVLKSTN